MSTVFSLICLSPSFQKMTHHFLLHRSLRVTNLEKNLNLCKINFFERFFQEYDQSVKQFESGWPGPFCQVILFKLLDYGESSKVSNIFSLSVFK